jgi:hypothetical protein
MTPVFPTIQCPNCHARLKMPEPVPQHPMICPGCGGRVPILLEGPDGQITAQAPPLPSVVPSDEFTAQAPPPQTMLRRTPAYNFYTDPKRRDVVVILGLFGAIGTAALWYDLVTRLTPSTPHYILFFFERIPFFRFDPPPLSRPGAVLIGLALMCVVVVAFPQMWIVPSSLPRGRSQAKFVLAAFANTGVLFLGLIAVCFLLFVVCYVVRPY